MYSVVTPVLMSGNGLGRSPRLSLPAALAPPTRANPARCAGHPLIPHGREQHDLTDRAPPGEEHDQAVDSDPDPARRRHPVFQGLDERLVVGLGLLVAGPRQLT